MSSDSSPQHARNFAMDLTTGSADIHICGACKQNFTDLNLFMEHKRSQCFGTSHDHNINSQPLLELVTTSSTDEMAPSTSGLHPLFRITLEGENLTAQQETKLILQHLQANGISGSLILRSRLLGLNEEQLAGNIAQPVVSSADSPNNGTFMQQLILQSQPSKREFQMDEEDVATLLANQLANEVCTANPPCDSSFGGELLSRVSISQDRDTTSPEPANLFSTEDADIERRGGNMQENGRTSDQDDSFNSPLPPQDQYSLPDMELPQGGLDCPSDPQDLQESKLDQSLPRLKKRHCCDVAGCTFASFYLKDLARHMRKHTGERPYRCKLCSHMFSRSDKLQIHQRIHAGIKAHSCTVCEYATVDASSLRKHMRIHNDERPFKCQICNYRSRTTSHLTVHLRTHTGDTPFVCPNESCSSAFKTSSDLRRHVRLHSGEKPYSCELCDYSCNIKSNLRVHVRLNHTMYKPVPCSKCKHVASSKRAAREHDKLHAAEILKCGLCKFTSTDSSVMKTHLAAHSQENSVSCKHCMYTCRHIRNLKKHLKKKHPDIQVGKSGKPGVVGTHHARDSSGGGFQKLPAHFKPYCNKTHHCNICGVGFVREDSWRCHLRQHKLQGSKVDAQRSPSHSLDEETKEAASHISPYLISSNTHSPSPPTQEDSVIKLSRKDSSTSMESGDGKKTGETEATVHREALRTNSPPPHSLYVYVTDGGSDGDLRGNELLANPLVFTNSCGPFMTLPTDPLSAPLQYVLSGPLDSLVGGDTFITKDSLGGTENFLNKEPMIGSDTFMQSTSRVSFIEADVYSRNSTPSPERNVEVCGKDSVIKKF